MTKEICPFLGKVRDDENCTGNCIQDQCMFFNGKQSRCIFLDISAASNEYLESLKRMSEQNELILLRNRVSQFSESEKKERISFYANQADIYRNKGNFSKAMLEYKKSLILGPTDPAVHESLGDIYSIQGVLEEAISSYRQSLKSDPENGETWIKLILQYRAFTAGMPDREKQNKEYLDRLTQEIRELKNLSMANCIEGNANLILHPNDPEAHALQRDKASVMLNKALELDPKNIWAHLGIKDVKLYNNDYEGAINQLVEGLKQNPDNTRLTFELAECYLLAQADHAMQTEDAFAKAQEGYKTVLNKDPRYATAYFRLGYIAENRAFYDQAIEYYQQGLSINPTNSVAHFRMGKIHLLMGMFELAIERFKEVINLSKNQVYAIYQEGYRFNKLRFFNEATPLDAWIELGKIYVKRRNYDDAFDAFQKALDIDKSSPLAIMNQIDLYKIRTEDLKDSDTVYSKYIEQYKNAAMLDFQNPVAHFALAYACQVFPANLAEKQEELMAIKWL